MTRAWMLLVSFFAVTAAPATDLSTEIRKLEQTIVKLNEMQARVVEGYLPSLEDLEIARVTRHEILRQFDAVKAKSLGFSTNQLRARLLDGVKNEIRMLAELGVDPAPPGSASASPLLEDLFALEQATTKEALRRLYRRGLPSPLDLGGLADEPTVSLTPEDVREQNVPDGGPAENSNAKPISDPTLKAESHYTARRYENALALYKSLDLPLIEDTIHTHYRMANCLLNLERHKEAADKFREIADAFPETAQGKSAAWNADYATALVELNNTQDSKQ